MTLELLLLERRKFEEYIKITLVSTIEEARHSSSSSLGRLKLEFLKKWTNTHMEKWYSERKQKGSNKEK